MPENRKTFHRYPSDTFKDEYKFLPSFFLDFEHFGVVKQAEVRPNIQDKGYFQVSINNSFLPHIHNDQEGVWRDFLGNSTEIYMIVGKLIQEHENLLAKEI